MAVSTRFYPGQKDYIEQLNLTVDEIGAGGGGSEFNSSSFRVKDSTDPTKKAAFDVAAIPTGTVRTYSLPNANTTLAALSVVQTWTAAQTMNSGTFKLAGSTSGALTVNAPAVAGSGTVTLPATGTIAVVDAVQTWTAAQTHNSGTFKLAGSTSGALTVNAPAVAGTGTITLPASGTIAVADGTQTWSAVQTYGAGNFKLSGSTSGAVTFAVPAVAGSGTLTFPASGNVPAWDATQTWTGVQTFNSSNFKLAGSTSGAITVNAPAVAGSGTVTFPATGTLAAADAAQSWSAVQTFNAGNFKLGGATSGAVTFAVPAVAGSGTLTFPASGTVAQVDNVTQTFAGLTTFSSNVTFSASMLRSVQTGISAAGTTQGTATALTKDLNIVSTVASGAGVKLPTAVVGMRVVVKNAGANALLVYPDTGGTIDALATNAAYSIPVGETRDFSASTTTQWYVHSGGGAGGSGDMLLGTTQTVTAAKTFNDSTLKLAGATSGTGTLKAPAVASTYVWTAPSATTTLLGVSDIVDNLTTNNASLPLSAAQGLALSGMFADRIRFGTGVPSNGMGNDGDAFVRMDSPYVGTIYKKASGAWALAQLATTWASRPSASSNTNAVITISDYNHDFYSNGTDWIPLGKRVKIDSFVATSYPSRTTGTAASQNMRQTVIPAGLLIPGCVVSFRCYIDMAGTGAGTQQIIISDSLSGNFLFNTGSGSSSAWKSCAEQRFLHVNSSSLALGTNVSNGLASVPSNSALLTSYAFNYTGASTWTIRGIFAADQSWQLMLWDVNVDYPYNA